MVGPTSRAALPRQTCRQSPAAGPERLLRALSTCSCCSWNSRTCSSRVPVPESAAAAAGQTRCRAMTPQMTGWCFAGWYLHQAAIVMAQTGVRNDACLPYKWESGSAACAVLSCGSVPAPPAGRFGWNNLSTIDAMQASSSDRLNGPTAAQAQQLPLHGGSTCALQAPYCKAWLHTCAARRRTSAPTALC
jgi:hypothetical protein